MAHGNLAAVRGAAGACKEAERWAAARRRKSPTSEVDVRLDLQPVGTAGFDASGGVSRRCRAEPGKRSVGAAGAEAQPATP